MEADNITRRLNRQNGDCVFKHVAYLAIGALMPEGGVCRLTSFQQSKSDADND